MFKRWVKCFRINVDVSINTTNGVERQNGVLKQLFLQQRSKLSLSDLIDSLTSSFLPDTYNK